MSKLKNRIEALEKNLKCTNETFREEKDRIWKHLGITEGWVETIFGPFGSYSIDEPDPLVIEQITLILDYLKLKIIKKKSETEYVLSSRGKKKSSKK